MIITTSQSDQDLEQILLLQQKNLPKNLPQEEIDREGFVTVMHRFEDLKKMNGYEQSVIAKEHDEVVAYLIAMTEKSKQDIPVLVPMFEVFNEIIFKGKKISEYKYMVVGQVCVAKEFRGLRLLDACYAEYKKIFSGKYAFAITEISKKNPRSLKAHERIGFKTVHEYIDSFGVDWCIVLWDWS
ncbi:MAG: GNAT family N-acetyltransferase [Bacteroidetes bacterium]|nr:GNAT family N-acetyltransferase [Bacteroidota bacterium]